jgi:glycosyltransferase involved in cell wall biosynthesis
VSDCVYATAGWGIHDERWLSALREIGRDPAVVSLGRDASDADDLRSRVRALALSGEGGGHPILAGPLDTVTCELAALPLTVVGLSWGYDLDQMAERGEDLGWLAEIAGLVVDSEFNRGIAERAGVRPDDITFLPWGVDLAEFAFHGPWIDAFLLGVPPHAPLVVSLRAHEPLYRVDDVVRAFARVERHPDAHEDFPDPYLIIGHSGSQTASLRQLVGELGIEPRVRFVGSVPEADLAPLLGRAACYATAAATDGTSVTLLQAMACGAPVVASATPGNLGWVEDGVTGFSFPTGDVAAMGDLMQRVLDRYPTEVVQRARARVEREADWHANLPRLARALGSRPA